MFLRISTVGVCFSLAFVVAAAFHSTHTKDVKHRKYPCPDAEDIAPCYCIYDNANGDLDLMCSDLSDIQQLANVFNAYFPFKNFNEFTLRNSNISMIPEGIFRGVYFERMFFINNKLKTIMSGALKENYGNLEQFHVTEFNDESGYDWPLPDIESFTALHDIGISGPHDIMEPLVSSSLEEVLLDLRHLTTLPNNPFNNAPSLTKITLQDTLLQDLEFDIFLSLTDLETVDLSGNQLAKIKTLTLSFTSLNLTLIDLSNNIIDTIEPDAILGVSGPVTLNLTNNQLKELNQDPFQHLVTSITGDDMIDITGNPLICGCDLAWMVDIPDEKLLSLKGLQAACGVADGTFGIEAIKDFLHYQCTF